MANVWYINNSNQVAVYVGTSKPQVKNFNEVTDQMSAETSARPCLFT